MELVPSFIFSKERNIVWNLKIILGIRSEGGVSHLLLLPGSLSRLDIKPILEKKHNVIIKDRSLMEK